MPCARCGLPTSSSISLRAQRAVGQRGAQRLARRAAMSRAPGLWVAAQPPRRAARRATRQRERPVVARARRGGSSTRISVAWTTLRRSSARVSASRSKPATRDHSPMYIDGAYCACSPPMRSSAAGIGSSRALEQHLAREQRAVELALGEDAPVTGRRRARRRGRRSRRRAVVVGDDHLAHAEAVRRVGHVTSCPRARRSRPARQGRARARRARRPGRGSARRRAPPADRARRRRRGARAGSGPAPACCRP